LQGGDRNALAFTGTSSSQDGPLGLDIAQLHQRIHDLDAIRHSASAAGAGNCDPANGLGVKDLMEIWQKALSPETAHWLESIGRVSEERSLSTDLWVRIIYDFAINLSQRVVHRDHLLKSMIPSIWARVASFVRENYESSAREVEAEN